MELFIFARFHARAGNEGVTPVRSVAARLTLAAVVEIAYVVVTRTWLPRHADGIPLELLTTAFRVATIAVDWRLFSRDVIVRRPGASARRWQHPLFLAAAAVILLAPVVADDWNLPGLTTRVVFALTSIVIAVREEIFYRGVIQNLLERRAGLPLAIALSNVLFTAYHYKAFAMRDFTPLQMLHLFAIGSALGLIYAGTRSLWPAITIHGAYDVLVSFTPLLLIPGLAPWNVGLEVLGALVLALWLWRSGPGGAPARGPDR